MVAYRLICNSKYLENLFVGCFHNNLDVWYGRLLVSVGIKENLHIVDVTGAALAKVSTTTDKSKALSSQTAVAGESKTKKSKQNGSKTEVDEESAEMNKLMTELESIGMKLPSTLSQTEIRSPTEDKDVYAYFFLLKVWFRISFLQSGKI
jgi:hypothetical protein